MDLVDGKKWKGALITLPEEITKNENDKVKSMLFYIIGAKFKQTVRDKRKAQMSNRKFLVRIIFQVLGQNLALEFLHQFVKKEAPFLTSNDISNQEDPKEMVKKMAMIFDILIICGKSAGGVANVFKDIIDVLECEGNLLINEQLKLKNDTQMSENIKEQRKNLSKQRSLLLEHLLSVRDEL